MKQLPLVLAVMAAALFGGFAGGWLRVSDQAVQASLPQGEPADDGLLGVQKELEALRQELLSLTSELSIRDTSLAQPEREAPSSRAPVIPKVPDPVLSNDLKAELRRLRQAVSALEESVREGIALEPPVPAEVLREAPQQDRNAVQAFLDAYGLDPDAAMDQLIGTTYSQVLQRFGKPYYVTKDWDWRWQGTRSVLGDPTELDLRFSSGVVLRVRQSR